MTKLHITWVKSDIGYTVSQKKIIKALGLHRLNQTVIHDDSFPIRGMVSKVKHLLKVEVAGK